jgi:hypothetical protein
MPQESKARRVTPGLSVAHERMVLTILLPNLLPQSLRFQFPGDYGD